MNTLPAIGEDAVVIDTQPQTERETDAVLIERSWRMPDVFAAVFDRYYAEIHGFVARRLGRGRADDLASETFLIAFDRRRRYDLARADARPWLYGIASNLIARHRRAEVRQLRALARADREVLLLVAWAQLTCEEAAQALGIPAGTARSRLHRARRMTRAALTGEDKP